MSAAFQLDFTGPQTRCDFPNCIGDAFHDGDHIFAKTPMMAVASAARKIADAEEKGQRSVVLSRAEWSPLWMKEHSQPTVMPVVCLCAQRPYPHELSVHKKVGHEWPGSYSDYKEMRWPWSLRFAPDMEAQ
jgi:hypothetical protein